MKQYKSPKIKARAYREMDWEQRMYILVKKNQGWTPRKIARELDLSTQRVHQILNSMDKMTVKELEDEYNNWCLTSDK
jgi:DNA-directed RNA polymerase specialized sigma24 family protein